MTSIQIVVGDFVYITNVDLQTMYGIKPTEAFEVQAIINGYKVFLDDMFDGDWISSNHLQKTTSVEHESPSPPQAHYKMTIGGHIPKTDGDAVVTMLTYGHSIPTSDVVTPININPMCDLQVETSLRDLILNKTSELGWQRYIKWFAIILLLGFMFLVGFQSARAQQAGGVGQMGQGRGMVQSGQSPGGQGQGQGQFQSGTLAPAVGLNYMDFVIRRNIRRDFSGPNGTASKSSKKRKRGR